MLHFYNPQKKTMGKQKNEEYFVSFSSSAQITSVAQEFNGISRAD